MPHTKQLWIKDIRAGMNFQDLFLVTNPTQKCTKAGSPYIHMNIMDTSGSLEAKIWDAQLEKTNIVANKVYELKILTKDYRGKVDCDISNWELIEDAKPGDFVRASEFDPDEMWSAFKKYLEFNSQFFTTVAKEMFDEECTLQFKLSPAATGMHHAFLHGLLEHTLQMLEIGELLLQRTCFKDLNKDLCMFGLMFHDFCKINEYSTDPGFKRKIQGILVGHIPMGAAKVFEAANRNGVPEEVRDHMMHVILAHHRLLEWGSPVKFACPEAAFVHYIDNLHGDTCGILQKRAEATEETIKYGYYEDSMTIIAKSFNEILKESEGVPDGF